MTDGMKDGVKALLLNAAFALLIVFGTLAAYDRMDLSPGDKMMLMQTNAEHVFRL